MQRSGHFALTELDLDWDKFYSRLQQGTICRNPELNFADWLRWEVKGPDRLARPSPGVPRQTRSRVQQAVVINLTVHCH